MDIKLYHNGAMILNCDIMMDIMMIHHYEAIIYGYGATVDIMMHIILKSKFIVVTSQWNYDVPQLRGHKIWL